MPMLEEIHKPSGPLTLSSTPIENATFEQPIASSNRACLLLSRSQHLWRQNHKTLTTNKANNTNQIQKHERSFDSCYSCSNKRSNKQTEWLSIWNQCRCSRRSTPSGPLTLSSTPIKNATFEQTISSSNRAFLLLSRSHHLWRKNQKSLTTNRANDTNQIQKPEHSFDSCYSWSNKEAINKPSDYAQAVEGHWRFQASSIKNATFEQTTGQRIEVGT